MASFIDVHRAEVPVVAPLVRALLATGRADLHRACRDAALRPEIRRVFEENWRVYGLREAGGSSGARGSMSPGSDWVTSVKLV